VIPNEWLVAKTSIDRVEALMQPKDNSYRGHIYLDHAQWEQFKAKLGPGDELWEFRSPPETGQTGGQEGYVIVREGTPAEAIPGSRLW